METVIQSIFAQTLSLLCTSVNFFVLRLTNLFRLIVAPSLSFAEQSNRLNIFRSAIPQLVLPRSRQIRHFRYRRQSQFWDCYAGQKRRTQSCLHPEGSARSLFSRKLLCYPDVRCSSVLFHQL